MNNKEAIELIENCYTFRCCNEKLGQAFDLAIKALENEPKKGKWKKRREDSYECPFCGEENYYAYDEVLDKFNDNFCPNCGADMREAEE